MKIKRLAIHGFKSFVDKVVFNFPSGTSAVVGPNGCGKSNIVDAIRWVLGEQNARHLRGKHMEDVIFNGSEARKPLGMAEVVLTFSNEDGLAPSRFANFTEIEISRRLYRSGESEYYINKVQSRLRDVVELFTDTGIGTRAYSIIEQGQVGWLISAKPEDRRVIFEEAAGINKFKQKKDAALRRLEASKENLTRVNDIISEVKRQLNSLNRQAKKAERYKLLRDEHKAVDLELSFLEFSRVKDALIFSGKKLGEIKDAELKLFNDFVAGEGRLDEVKGAYLKEEEEFKKIRADVFEFEKLIQTEENASALALMRVEELRRSEERLAAEIEALKDNSRDSTLQIESIRATIAGMESFISEQSQKLAENTERLNAMNSEFRDKEALGRTQKTEAMQLSARLSDLRHSIQGLLRDEEGLRAREARAASEHESVTKALAAKAAPTAAVRESLSGLNANKDGIEAELKAVRERLEALEKEKAENEGRLYAARDEYALISARLSTLEQMERDFENLSEGARAIMKKGGETVYSLMADVIETNPGYEKAVEAVLGERLQYVIVEGLEDGMNAVEYLKTIGSGRTGFVPIRDLRPMVSRVPAYAGSVNYSNATELITEVRIKDGFEQIVGCLLADVLIVDEFSDAIDLWKTGGVYKTIVTRGGEIIDAEGILTGGGSSSNDAGILQKRGEIKRGRSASARLEAGISSLGVTLAETDAALIGAKTALEGARERLHGAELKRVNLQNELKMHEEEGVRLERTREALEKETSDVSVKMGEVAVRKAALSAQREEAEKALFASEERSAVLSAETARISEKKEQINQLVTEIRVSLAQATERGSSLNKQIAEKENSISAFAKFMEAKASEIERGRAESAGKVERIEEIRKRLAGLFASLDAVRTASAEKTESMETLSAGIRQAEHEVKDLKARHSELQELKGELTIELKEMELGIASARERITEKYGVGIDSYLRESDEPVDISALEGRKEDLREKIAALGEVSLSALEEYADLERRHQFLLDQQADLNKSVEALMSAISRINRTTREKFRTAFDEINARFQETFPRFFKGGRAELRLTEEGDILEAGIEIAAQPPGKRLQSISLLSGGEKALTATALIFAIFLTKPSPFCILDEVDAPLDDANIDRFNLFVHDMSKLSQFMLITHNKKTMEMADALYGITMEEPGVSCIITVKF